MLKMIDKEELNKFVNEVRERSDMFSVISKYVPLKSKGGQYWGCCPFHNEKTPSFTVSPDKGFFYCFGCHVGGNIFKFISLIENISYFEAVKLQAERLGIELPYNNHNKSPDQIKRDKQEKMLIKINTLAKDFFHSCLLKTTYGEVGRKYLESRGISNETIEEFELGFAPDSWDALSKALVNKKNMNSDQLIAAGVSKLRKDGSGIYDNFRNRVMIPIADLYGRVVAFGGRIIDDKSSQISSSTNPNNFEAPKYLNSPETLIFNKKNLLFGLNRATQAIRRLNYVIVVEGYMDVISVFSAGVKNVVASLGTAFTEEHAKLLTRYTRKIYFCYDSDEAGQKATMRAFPIILKENADVKVIVIPDGKDPDEFIRKHGVEEFKLLISKALPIFDYQLKYILSHNDYSSVEGKVNTLNQLIPIITATQDITRQSEYRKQIARILVMSEDAINAEIRKYKSRGNLTNYQASVSKESAIFEDKNQLAAERIVLKTIWLENDLLDHLEFVLSKEIFSPVHQEIIEYIKKCMSQGQRPDDISSAAELSDEASTEISKILLEGNNDLSAEAMQAYRDSVNTLKLKKLRLAYNKLMEEIKEISTGNSNFIENPDYINKMQQSIKIKEEMDKLKLL